MSSTISSKVFSIMIAAAQSVGKVFVIGMIGYTATKLPNSSNPFIPIKTVAIFARFSFYILTIPLIYTTTAIAVTPQNIIRYWFVIVGAFVVIGTSYGTATILAYVLPNMRRLVRSKPHQQPISSHMEQQQQQQMETSSNTNNNQDTQQMNDRYQDDDNDVNNHDKKDTTTTTTLLEYNALRIAATFPNIVALPILIFPSLCEYPIVYESYYGTNNSTTGMELYEDDTTTNTLSLSEQCVVESNAMIFCYFFAWSFCFWTFGNPMLMKENIVTTKKEMNSSPNNNSLSSPSSVVSVTSESSGSHTKNRRRDETIETDQHRAIVVNDTTHPNYFISPSHSSNGIASVPDHSISASNMKERIENTSRNESNVVVNTTIPNNVQGPKRVLASWTAMLNSMRQCTILNALFTTISSPGFLALFFGFITGCIGPLKRALFEPEGPLRFLGDSLQTLGLASSPLSTLVVAASLVTVPMSVSSSSSIPSINQQQQTTTTTVSNTHKSNEQNNEYIHKNNSNEIQLSDHTVLQPIDSHPFFDKSNVHTEHDNEDTGFAAHTIKKYPQIVVTNETDSTATKTNPQIISIRINNNNNKINDNDLSCHNKGKDEPCKVETVGSIPYYVRYFFLKLTQTFSTIFHTIIPPVGKDRVLLTWFTIARLFVAPLIIVSIILSIDCSGSTLLQDVPNMAKLVVIVNSCLPGALIVVVLLKSADAHTTKTPTNDATVVKRSKDSIATTVAKIYLPSYLLSIITIAGWTSIGLLITIPHGDTGLTFCQNYRLNGD